MKRTIFITSFGIAIILGLSLPSVSLAALNVVQSPSGSKLPSPVTFSVTADNFSDLNFGPGVNSWILRIFAVVTPPPAKYQTSCLSSTTLSAAVTSPAISESFPAQDYNLVLVGYYDSNCKSYATSSIVAGPVNITAASSLADWWPVLLVVVIVLGFAVIRKKNGSNPVQQ